MHRRVRVSMGSYFSGSGPGPRVALVSLSTTEVATEKSGVANGTLSCPYLKLKDDG